MSGLKKSGANSLKETEKKRKQVFKPVLDNPLTQSNVWPFVEPEVGTSLVDLLQHLLTPIGRYNEARKLQKINGSKLDATVSLEPPSIQKEITIGFNSTVKALEDQAQSGRKARIKSDSSNPSPEYIQYVFVTKFDISLALLLSPLPVLSYTASWSEEHRVKLVQLPKGSMAKLSSALKMENVGFIGLRASSSLASHLYELVNSNILDVEVPWLKGYLTGQASSYFAPPLAKVLATSAPVQAKKNNQKKRKVDKKEGSNKKEEEGRKEKVKEEEGRKKLRKKKEAEGKE